MSPHLENRQGLEASVPRASGDEPSGKLSNAPLRMCSPRERG